MNDRNITNARFIQVNQWPQDNGFTNNNVTNLNSNTLNNQAENDNEVITKAFVDQFHQFHQENERSRRDLGLSFYKE